LAPTVLNSGDTVDIGGQSYRVEIPAAAPRRAEGWQRRPEVGSSERPPAIALDGHSGCALPSLQLPDLSGCMPWLIRLLILIAILLVVGALIAGLFMGLGAIGGMLGGHATPAGPSGGQQGRGGGGEQGKGGGGSGEQPAQEAIVVKSVRIGLGPSRASGLNTQHVLVEWDNFTQSAVHKIWAKVTVFDQSGAAVSTTEEALIYEGAPVEAGGSHRDDPLRAEGFEPHLPITVTPRTAKVEITRYE
jgi:hypothetical protein